jgi:hypothetical protein
MLEIEASRWSLVPAMTLPDPDQDLLDKLDWRQRRSEVLAVAPAFGLALAAGLATFGILRFGVDWSAESALDVAGLVSILSAWLLTRHKNSENRF